MYHKLIIYPKKSLFIYNASVPKSPNAAGFAVFENIPASGVSDQILGGNVEKLWWTIPLNMTLLYVTGPQKRPRSCLVVLSH